MLYRLITLYTLFVNTKSDEQLNQERDTLLDAIAETEARMEALAQDFPENFLTKLDAAESYLKDTEEYMRTQTAGEEDLNDHKRIHAENEAKLEELRAQKVVLETKLEDAKRAVGDKTTEFEALKGTETRLNAEKGDAEVALAALNELLGKFPGDAQLDALREEDRTLRTKIEELGARALELNRPIQEAEETKAEVEATLTEVQTELETIEPQIVMQQQLVNTLNAKVTEMEEFAATTGIETLEEAAASQNLGKDALDQATAASSAKEAEITPIRQQIASKTQEKTEYETANPTATLQAEIEACEGIIASTTVEVNDIRLELTLPVGDIKTTETIATEREAANAEIARLQSEIDSIDSSVAENAELISNLTTLKTAQEQILADLTIQEQNRARLDSITEKEATIALKTQEKQTKTQQIEAIKAQVQDYQTAIDGLTASLVEKTEQLETLKANETAAAENFSTLQNVTARITAILNGTNAISLDDLNSKAEVAILRLDELTTEKSGYQDILPDLQQQIRDLVTQIDTIKAEIAAELNAIQAEYDTTHARLLEIEREIADITAGSVVEGQTQAEVLKKIQDGTAALETIKQEITRNQTDLGLMEQELAVLRGIVDGVEQQTVDFDEEIDQQVRLCENSAADIVSTEDTTKRVLEEISKELEETELVLKSDMPADLHILSFARDLSQYSMLGREIDSFEAQIAIIDKAIADKGTYVTFEFNYHRTAL